MLKPFLILEFADSEDGDVLFSESSREEILNHGKWGNTMDYREVFAHLRDISLDRRVRRLILPVSCGWCCFEGPACPVWR
jgi:hypothetical protein